MYSRITAIIFVLTLACGDSGVAGTETDATGGASTGADTGPTSSAGGSTGVDLEQLYGCKEEAFVASPLAGPLWDGAKGGIQGEPKGSYVLHTTQIYVRPEGAEAFGALAQAVAEEAAQIEGVVAYSIGTDDGCGVARTMGIWESEEAMYKLVMSEAHAKAMAATGEVAFSGRVIHWTVTAGEANAYTWDVARAKVADVAPSPLY